MSDASRWTRRSSLKGLGLMGTGSLMLGQSQAAADSMAGDLPSAIEIRNQIAARVEATPFIDTHEHLCEEQVRLAGSGPDDWSLLLAGYLGSDLRTAGTTGVGPFEKKRSKSTGDIVPTEFAGGTGVVEEPLQRHAVLPGVVARMELHRQPIPCGPIHGVPEQMIFESLPLVGAEGLSLKPLPEDRLGHLDGRSLVVDVP